ICPGTESRTARPQSSQQPNSETNRNRNRQLVGNPVPVHTTNRPISATHAINALSSWQEVSLRVPDSLDESDPPVPPPRKKKLQREQERQQGETRKFIQRPPRPNPPSPEKSHDSSKNSKKRRIKTLSTVSLPNYDTSLSVYSSSNDKSGQKSPPRNESSISLPGKGSGLSSFSEATVEKIENCVRRCRSFGAFKTEPLKLKTSPMNGRHSSESDDSFDGLDDWDLRVIEHCDAHEISPIQTMLPPQRQRKPNYIFCEKKYETEELQKQSPNHVLSSSPTKTDEDLNPPKSASTDEDLISRVKVTESNHIIDSKAEMKVDAEEKGNLISPVINCIDDSSPKNVIETNIEMARASVETGKSDDDKIVVYDFMKRIKRGGSDDKRLVINGILDTQEGLKTPPPTPEINENKKEISLEDNMGHSSLLRLLKEYQTADGKLEDSGAHNVLKGLGIPPSLKEVDVPSVHKPQEKINCGSRGSSGRSSMTPSLSELEAALSDLLEASASKTGADEDEDDVMAVTMVTSSSTPVQQTLRVISPKPYSTFSNSFHPIQSTTGNQVAETSA
ncbi:hypothetical protein L9F63_003656, partial [Diploptera punctata]